MTDAAYRDDRVTLYHGDCLDVLAELPDASVDSVVTDPPYGLDFMGKNWDTGAVAFDTAIWGHALRVLKPGGHLLAFGGTRTWHRLACAIEDAGFEIRDNIAWLYGSGFPKSLDVSKAIDKANGRYFEDRFALGRHIRERRTAAGLTAAEVNAWFGYRDGCQHWERQDHSGARVPTLADWVVLQERLRLSDEWRELVERVEAEREVIGTKSAQSFVFAPGEIRNTTQIELEVTAPATDDAKRWAGWGTALKPAFEPIVVGRKPLSGTVAATVLAHGTGALNIDGCRIGTDERTNRGMSSLGVMHDDDWKPREVNSTVAGRWPSNVVIDDATAAEVDRQSGITKTPETITRGGQRTGNSGLAQLGRQDDVPCYGHIGGASRFFPTFRYQAKAPTDERPTAAGIAHPTVKPLDLMRWLVRLVTPPGGTVLEPFAGSGTTAEACIHEHLNCIAIEREADYLPLIVARLSKPMAIGFDFEVGA